MAPPTLVYPVSTLEAQVNVLPNGRPRNPPVELSTCKLKELVQYKCNIYNAEKKGVQPTIMCEPVVRLLRKCQNTTSVETTAWEGWREKQVGGKVER